MMMMMMMMMMYDDDDDDDDDYEDDDDDYEDMRGGRSNSLNFHEAMFFSLTRLIHLTRKIKLFIF